jgi:two-component system, response regulator
MPNPVTILLIEDDPDDESLTVRALRMGTSAKIEVARDGQQALDHLLNDANDTPRLVLLDLKLPAIDGLKVLRRIREHERTCLTPVVILTGGNAQNDVVAGYRHGANSYVRKPVDFDQFAEVIHQLGLYWLVLNEPPPNVRGR